MILDDTAVPVTASAYRKQMQDTRKNILENIAKKDPARAATLKAGLSRVDETIANLERSKRDIDSDRKEAALQKIDRLKKELQLLRLRSAGDPKTAARMAARLSRELASAVRDYGGAGASMPSDDLAMSGKKSGISAMAEDATAEEIRQFAKKLKAFLQELRRKHRPGAAAGADIDAASAAVAQLDIMMSKGIMSILV